MLHEHMLSYLVKTDFNSPTQLALSWSTAILTLAFGVYAWMAWEWSSMWVVSGIVSILLCTFNPLRWMQRKLSGIIKRPSH